MEQLSYEKKIDVLLGEYFDYRKTQEALSQQKEEAAASSETGSLNKWLPKPLEEAKGAVIDLSAEIQPIIIEQAFIVQEEAEEEEDSLYASALSDSLAKKIYPFASDEVVKMDYEGSPIYSDLDRETLAQMTVSAYNNALTSVPELGDLEAEGERAYFTKAQIFKSLIRELILRDVFFMRYNKKYW